MSESATLFSFGHSTRSAAEIVEILRAHRIERLVDVRAHPGSRRYPHVGSDVMRDWLGDAGIEYLHLRSLGGRRRPQPGSPNAGWTNRQFQGYADHMRTPEFREGLARLLELCETARTTCMCSEAQWWRCHRRMICDAALAAGGRAVHIMSETSTVAHELTGFAAVEDGQITYPPSQAHLPGCEGDS